MVSLRSAIARIPLARGAFELTRRLARPRPTLAAAAEGTHWFDLYAPGAAREPFADYERLRNEGPVHFLPRHGCWILLDHADVKSALERPDLFSSAPQRAIDALLLGADAPGHEAVRRLLARHFAGPALAELSECLRADAGSMILPRMDLVADFAIPLTRRLAARLVGLEQSEVEAILAAPDISAPASAMSRSSRALLQRARIHADLRADSDNRLGDDEACSLVRLLCRAATETSERLIVRAAAALLDRPEVRREVERGGPAMAQLVEEALRLWPPESNVVRVATRPVAVGGVELPAGAHVFLSLLAANRDPSLFEDPARLRLDRSRPQHLAFAGGPHQCIGAGLGRRAATIALQVLVDRDFRRADGAEPEELAIVQGIETPTRLIVST